MSDREAGGDTASRHDLHDPAERGLVERALEAIPGVLAARLVPGFDRPVDELHVLISMERSPKQVVRDVQSLLFTRFDLSIDHRVISVVQLDDDDPIAGLQDAPGEARSRVALARVSVTQAAANTIVAVTVTDANGNEHVGESYGQPSVTGARTAAAEATLAALEHLLSGTASAVLQAMRVVDGGGVDVALAVVNVRAGRSDMVVTGSALVRRGEADAVARSILDALNRVVHLPH